MRTIHSRNNSRGHGRRRYEGEDEFSQSGFEDSYRNEDYYFERRQHQRGYDNRDHSGTNYWPSGSDIREEREGQYGDYVPGVNYGHDNDSRGGQHAYGYGNEGSPSMREYERWSNRREPEGYFGRNSNDYRQGYDDRYRFEPGTGNNRNEISYRDRETRDPWDERNESRRYGYGEY